MDAGTFVPKWIAWEVTGHCNLACIHCRAACPDADTLLSPGAGALQQTAPAKGVLPGLLPTDYSTADAKALLEDIASYCKPVLVLSGGEPLLRPDLFELARHGTELGLKMAMATNGTLVTDEVCGKIKESGIRIVSLSLDGPNTAVHDDFRRQPGAFEATLKAAEAFKRHGIEFIVNSSFTKRNQGHIGEVYRLAKSIGAKAWYLFMVVPTGRGKDLLSELITKEDYEGILEWHALMEREEHELLVRPTCAPHYYRVVRQLAKKEGVPVKQRSLSFSTGGSKGCIAGQSIVFIDHQGGVHPCSYFPDLAGSLRTSSFKEIWENSPLLKSLRDFKSYKGRCGECEFLNVCGGCRARALLMDGDHLGEEPLCGHIPLRRRRTQEGAT
ncbi:MAG: radical SAM protein [Elusimicrobiota bacterium]|jgi:radical SAM protein with 4Fe4S-binding SPASM domain